MEFTFQIFQRNKKISYGSIFSNWIALNKKVSIEVIQEIQRALRLSIFFLEISKVGVFSKNRSCFFLFTCVHWVCQLSVGSVSFFEGNASRLCLIQWLAIYAFLKFRALRLGRNFVFGYNYFFFAFSTQNLVLQIIIGISRVIFQIEGFSVVIRTT